MSSKMVKGQRAEAEIGVMAPRLNDRRIKNLNQTTEGNWKLVNCLSNKKETELLVMAKGSPIYWTS
jgi:hypothetical protein